MQDKKRDSKSQESISRINPEVVISPYSSQVSTLKDLDGFGMEAFYVGELVSAEFGVNKNGQIRTTVQEFRVFSI
jgi:hypothetical protein